MWLAGAREASPGSSGSAEGPAAWLGFHAVAAGRNGRMQPPPSAAAFLLTPHSHFRQARLLGFGSFERFRSFAHFEISPPAPPLASQRFRATEEALRCLTSRCSDAKLASGNLKQSKMNLRVCEGVGASTAGEKGAAPGEGPGGFAPTQATLTCCCRSALGASSSGCQQHGAPTPKERWRDLPRKKASVKNNKNF